MNDLFTVLAQTAENQQETAAEQLVPLDTIWQTVSSLDLLEALTFVAFGVVCLFYGWRVFKVLVVISFAFLGMGIGVFISEKVSGQQAQVMGGLIGMVVMAVLSVPLMRWAVSILGAVAGGLVGAAAWYAAKLPETFIWAGALVGVVAGGMISFIVFRIAVMLFSAIGGAALIVAGTLALLFQYPPTSAGIEDLVFNYKWFLPAALAAPTIIGIIMQNKFIKGSQDWSV